MLIPKDQIKWRLVPYLRQGETNNYDYLLWLNEPLASWDVWDYWERARVKSMEKHLKKGDILFDIGTEQGWCDLVYANIVGPENMVLVEPTPDFWPNIKALWEKNFPGIGPNACYPGFFSDKSANGHITTHNAFPIESDGDLIDKNSYRNLWDKSHTKEIQQITLDEFVKNSGITPGAITIDVEGAEFLVLNGAKETLKKHDLKVWVSEHDDLALKDYAVYPGDVTIFMRSLGYYPEILSVDHERHVYYSKI